VQIEHSSRRGSRDIEHIGSAHDDVELELLKAVARQRLAAGQGELDLGLGSTAPAERGGLLLITSSRMSYLWDALIHTYQVLGFRRAAGGDEVFRDLVLARLIEPTSKLDSLRVLEEIGVQPPAYATLKRRLPVFATDSWGRKVGRRVRGRAQLGEPALPKRGSMADGMATAPRWLVSNDSTAIRRRHSAERRVVPGGDVLARYSVSVEERLYAEKTSPGVFQYVRAVKVIKRLVKTDPRLDHIPSFEIEQRTALSVRASEVRRSFTLAHERGHRLLAAEDQDIPSGSFAHTTRVQPVRDVDLFAALGWVLQHGRARFRQLVRSIIGRDPQSIDRGFSRWLALEQLNVLAHGLRRRESARSPGHDVTASRRTARGPNLPWRDLSVPVHWGFGQ
jgi:hypothetical protein